MRIKQVIPSGGRSGYYNSDFQALRLNPEADGAFYRDKPVTPGFQLISQPGRCVCMLLVLESGAVALGDCIDVILAGIGGRFPPFDPEVHFAPYADRIADFLIGSDVDGFRSVCTAWTAYAAELGLHTAICYGVSQALLHAASLSLARTMCEVIRDEYGLEGVIDRVPLLIFCQRDNNLQIDRALMKRADLLPHGSFPDVKEHLGESGEKLIAYVQRICRRVEVFGEEGYAPTIHVDVYGSIAKAFPEPKRMADYILQLGAAAAPLSLMVESPIVAQSQSEQIDCFAELRECLQRAENPPKIIVDEWCNTAEDVRLFADRDVADIIHLKMPDLGSLHDTIEVAQYCMKKGAGFALGGSANETDVSARVSAHVGLATQPVFMIGKPGMGMDEGLMIVDNEQRRTLALLSARGK